jgi:outer membrane protein TolC
MVRPSSKILFVLLLTPLFLLMPLSWAHAVSLQEALNTALTQNPKPLSKDLQVLALKDRTTAAWLGLLPRLSVAVSRQLTRSHTTVEDITTQSKARSDSGSLSVTMNLFDGGTQYYSARIAENNMKATEALFNSTNPLVENTKGALATLMMHAYLQVVFTRALQVEFQGIVQALEVVEKFARKEDDRVYYRARIANLNIEIQKFVNMEGEALADYAYVANAAAPKDFDTMAQVIESLVLPATSDEAFVTAKLRSPDLRYRSYQLKAAEYATKIASAERYMPRVDLMFSRGANHNLDRITPAYSSRGKDESFYLSVSWNFDPGSIHRSLAAKKELRSARLEQQAALQDLEHNIRKAYIQVKSNENLLSSYLTKYESAVVKVQATLDRVEAGEDVSREVIGGDLDDLIQTGMNIHNTRSELIRTKFSIQQSMGTLFSEAVQQQAN